MTPFLDSWTELAVPILAQALEKKVLLAPGGETAADAIFVVFGNEVSGEMQGRFLIKAEKQAIESLIKLGADAVFTLWPELFERIGNAVSEALSKKRGSEITASVTEEQETTSRDGVPFLLTVGEQVVPLLLVDGAKARPARREDKESAAD